MSATLSSLSHCPKCCSKPSSFIVLPCWLKTSFFLGQSYCSRCTLYYRCHKQPDTRLLFHVTYDTDMPSGGGEAVFSSTRELFKVRGLLQTQRMTIQDQNQARILDDSTKSCQTFFILYILTFKTVAPCAACQFLFDTQSSIMDIWEKTRVKGERRELEGENRRNCRWRKSFSHRQRNSPFKKLGWSEEEVGVRLRSSRVGKSSLSYLWKGNGKGAVSCSEK